MVNDQTEIAIWDPDAVEIRVQGGTHPHDLIRELHALLTIDLGVSTTTGAGLHCFCGTPLVLPDELAPVSATMVGASTL
ncbi:hypothetical protein ACFXCZ_27365 [Streptomyces sp. NPDC059396]|uniref:hypothetical protein n=1 Tax=Streptomyces sp. NPDC059396 TaxID=3346819 RepID=UPI0036772BF4